ncbi:hypothetical protein GO988_20165 [Hymenobacter sp. HMF4947]|uniref:Uncharacterized protein n=1 Tax=Hymenobacter ginkgonis TaxID=2682976 RepID=A0A7K1TJT2_9BACT|nr:hypothetical protein [Hymenobacter ginkgonis]MVN78655.1 hypothetical protein [Hymenobacter ginkgonis]
MKFLLLLAGTFACSTSATLAQTVLPSGAVAPAGTVAPSGAVVTPATVPGSQPLGTSTTRDAGSPRAARHDVKVPGMTHQERKEMRKMGKMKPGSGSN